MEIVKNLNHPEGLALKLLKLPVHFYRLGLGRLFGERMLMINHVGRVTGKQRSTVVEVIRHEQRDDSYLIASGWGPRTDWYRNLLSRRRATIQVAGRTKPVRVEPLPQEEATEIVAGYFWRNRAMAKRLLPRLYGYAVDGSKSDFYEVARHVPMVRLIPTR
ncbi:nitroreductase family deazaflavin-dependent oxidoreductase [Streptomyces spirodelae]|uniref:Nitroreductase family deazaflavin-dependent oxidoreductase n=1 Tax=Streptomyces spirodelae TaxID=2812904 RepID=A0ABS3WMF8_9ACTN|nr:nitroreductase family deazaflavin-dependent oxidoreductase [Streptomyces spirodelae]MBO8184309.1 nitroreductase family deazaflavin-dependent oxidoreductase [Streptomyces spirodelae]